MNLSPFARLALFIGAASISDYFRLVGAVGFTSMVLSLFHVILEAGVHVHQVRLLIEVPLCVLTVATAAGEIMRSIIVPVTNRILGSEE